MTSQCSMLKILFFTGCKTDEMA